MNIKKLQGGGIAPFLSYTPNVGVPTAPEKQSASEVSGTAKKEEEGLLSKEMIKLLMEEAIPSDVEAFMTQLGEFENNIYGGMSIGNSSQMYNMLIPKINQMKYNKENLAKTRDHLYKNGGFNEVAITTNGGVVASKDGEMKIIDIDEYKKNPSDYKLLTNNELDKLRSYDKNLAFNNNIVGILENGQGADNVTKELQTVISQMATQKDKKQGLIPPEQIEALKGIDAIKGIAKVTMSHESSRVYKEHAKEYLYNMLQPQSRNLLRVKAAQKGIEPKDMIELLILPSTFDDKDENIDISDVSGIGIGKGSKEGSGTANFQFLDQWVGNTLGGIKPYEFNTGSNYSFTVPASKVTGFISAKEQKMLPTNSTLETIINESLTTIGDANNVYIGNEKVEFDKLNKIVSTGTNNSKAYMPLDLEALSKGEYKPDLMVAEKLKEVANRIKNEKVPQELHYTIYKEEGVEEYYGDAISNPYFAPFAVIKSVVQGEDFVKGGNQQWFKKIENDDNVRKIMDKSMTGDSEKSELLDGVFGWNWASFSDVNLYEGLAFVHTPDNPEAAAMAGNYLTMPKGYKDFETVQRNKYENEQMKKIKNAQTKTNILEK